ncbi:hypothetical protein SLE2022_315200 [Rubroshorea leprosula]
MWEISEHSGLRPLAHLSSNFGQLSIVSNCKLERQGMASVEGKCVKLKQFIIPSSSREERSPNHSGKASRPWKLHNARFFKDSDMLKLMWKRF